MPSHPPSIRTRKVRTRTDATSAGGGVLVAIVGAERRGKEMLVAIARRRFEADASLDFPARLTTRPPSDAQGDTVVNRRTLRDLAAEGALLCQWETDGHAFGLGVALRQSLEAGRTVVVVASQEAVEDLRRVWDDVRVIEVTAGVDRARQRLVRQGPERTVAGSAAARGAAIALHHPGDVASAVRVFHDLIGRIRLERLGEAAPAGRALSSATVVKRFAGGVTPRKGLRVDRLRA